MTTWPSARVTIATLRQRRAAVVVVVRPDEREEVWYIDGTAPTAFVEARFAELERCLAAMERLNNAELAWDLETPLLPNEEEDAHAQAEWERGIMDDLRMQGVGYLLGPGGEE